MAPPPTTMEEAQPVNQSRHSTWLGWALGRFTRLLADGPTKPSRPPLPTTTPPPLALMEELEEEILLRFPPHERALLVRASLVCKRWRRLVSDPRFRRRFRELHRAPPMLGFLCNIADDSEDASTAGFVATAAFYSPDADLDGFRPLDARHGCVLLHSSEDALVVWDPIANDALQLPVPDLRRYTYSWTAAGDPLRRRQHL